MELIEWNDQFATGIAGIDHEHEELIATINSFYSKLTEDSDKDGLINILNDIYGTIHAHFMLEEKLMKRHGYDHYAEHSDDHARLLDDLRDIAMSLESPSDFNEQQLKIKLNDWFLVHFKTHDSRLHKLEQLIASQSDANKGFMSGLKKLKAMFLQKKQ